MLEFLYFVVALIVLVVIAFKLYCIRLGKSVPVIYTDRRTEFKATEFKEKSMTVECEMPYMNTGNFLKKRTELLKVSATEHSKKL